MGLESGFSGREGYLKCRPDGTQAPHSPLWPTEYSEGCEPLVTQFKDVVQPRRGDTDSLIRYGYGGGCGVLCRPLRAKWYIHELLRWVPLRYTPLL